jgi:hypothetical protein
VSWRGAANEPYYQLWYVASEPTGLQWVDAQGDLNGFPFLPGVRLAAPLVAIGPG